MDADAAAARCPGCVEGRAAFVVIRQHQGAVRTVPCCRRCLGTVCAELLARPFSHLHVRPYHPAVSLPASRSA